MSFLPSRSRSFTVISSGIAGALAGSPFDATVIQIPPDFVPWVPVSAWVYSIPSGGNMVEGAYQVFTGPGGAGAEVLSGTFSLYGLSQSGLSQYVPAKALTTTTGQWATGLYIRQMDDCSKTGGLRFTINLQRVGP